MNNKITRFIFGIHAISNIISSDENKIKKIYFKNKKTFSVNKKDKI